MFYLSYSYSVTAMQ